MIMELLCILGIGFVECIKGLYHRKFDTMSFWNKCMKVNVIYTKFFQSVALNYNLNIEIHKIPYEESELVYPTDITVTNIIGSGLISIVFEGLTESGQRVVIKTKRKNIEHRVLTSLTKLHNILNCIHWVYPIPCLFESYHEISKNFQTQLDFVSELKNHQRFYDMFNGCEYIKVPELYLSECSEHRIVMEKLEGIPISDLTDEQKERCVTWLSKMVIQCLLKHGFIHADLHAGNIMFNDTHIGIIDFGFMMTIEKEEVDILSNLFREFAMENFNVAAQHTMNFLSPLDTLTADQLEDVRDFIVHIYQKTTVVDKLFSIYDILQIMKKIRMYHLQISPMFYNICIGITSIESVLTHLSSTSSDFIMNAVVEVLSLQIENREGEDHTD